MAFEKKRQPYITVLSLILAAVVLLYSVRAFYIQVVNPKAFGGYDGYRTFKTVIAAPRGEILDSSGREIAINRDGYDVVLNYSNVNMKTVNSLLERLIAYCEAAETEYVDDIPLEKAVPYGFKENENTSRLKKFLGVAEYATAEDCFARLVEKFSLQEYSTDMQRKLMGVRYTMSRAGFSLSAPYTFAEDIPASLMLTLSEQGFLIEGVSVETVPYRQYSVTTLAPHLIGSIGPIYKEDWDTYKQKGYSYNDRVGKSGIELYAEDYLRGTDGEMTYKIDENGKIVSSYVSRAPIPGKTVMLTLDKSLQLSAQNALEKYITYLKGQAGSTVKGGSVVVVNVKSGAVLVSANYPSYDMATLSENYNDLVDKQKNPDTPLLDRAFQGVYPLGSTVKPAVAIAAMESGKYTAGEVIYCSRTYNYFSDYKPRCMHFHGDMDLTSALSKSCNYFFFELGRRSGVKAVTQYFKDFGLGVRTGVEVNDSAGILTEFDRDSGNTLQVSIGQLNAFTPLQAANYIATLANGGTHYKATLIDKIMSADFSETYFSGEPTVQNEVKITPEILSAVKAGMLSVTEDGTGQAAFKNYPIKVGGKTGTSQVVGKADHSVFVAFAPFDNPEIAISVVLEHGSSGYGTTNIAKEVLDGYFFADSVSEQEKLPYTPLR